MTDIPTDAAQPVTLREAAVEALVALREMAKEEKVSARLTLGIDASIMLHTALANAHPEDAPGGPYEVGECTDDMWIVRPKLTGGYVKWRFEGTEAECIAVRDVINRLDTKGEK